MRNRGDFIAEIFEEPLLTSEESFHKITYPDEIDEIHRKTHQLINEGEELKRWILYPIGFLIFCLFFLLTDKRGYFTFFTALFAFVFSLAIFFLYDSYRQKKRKVRDLEIQKNELEYVQIKEIEELKQKDEELYAKRRKRYEKMYYCHRDDLFFIPGEPEFVNSSDYEIFLNQDLLV